MQYIILHRRIQEHFRCGIISSRKYLMHSKYRSEQKVFLTRGNTHLIMKSTILKYTEGSYTIPFDTGGGIKVRESGICPTRKEAETAILNKAR